MAISQLYNIWTVSAIQSINTSIYRLVIALWTCHQLSPRLSQVDCNRAFLWTSAGAQGSWLRVIYIAIYRTFIVIAKKLAIYRYRIQTHYRAALFKSTKNTLFLALFISWKTAKFVKILMKIHMWQKCVGNSEIARMFLNNKNLLANPETYFYTRLKLETDMFR